MTTTESAPGTALESNVKTKPTAKGPKTVKVLVWDLDNTLWDGILLEGDDVTLRPGVEELLATLDRRGILHSVASRNDHDAAWAKLEELGVADYFLYPQIHWGSKASSVKRVAESINIGLDTVAFVDDQPFERDEVASELSQVRTYDATELAGLAELEDFTPRFITDESAMRRKMYQADAQRKQAEGSHEGPSEEFLAGLDMHFVIHPPRDEDLKRAEELTMRTNQLNTTGYTYSYDELDALRHDPDHLLLVASLEDRYGTYGKIGLALVEKGAEAWTIKLLLMSCRVMSRGVGTILMNHIMALAKEAGVKLRAEFRSNGRNRMMRVTYRLGGFEEAETDGERSILEHDLEHIQDFPEYVEVRIEE
jgi:FkbH-like protein